MQKNELTNKSGAKAFYLISRKWRKMKNKFDFQLSWVVEALLETYKLIIFFFWKPKINCCEGIVCKLKPYNYFSFGSLGYLIENCIVAY